MGLLPSANFSQKRMVVYVLNGLIYNICELYIDDMLVFGGDDDAFIRNGRTVFVRCWEENATSINMSKKRTESAIDFSKPN